MTQRTIKVVPYNPVWVKAFELEKQLLQSSIKHNIIDKIHHIGSTSVLGLSAKPIIDILLETNDLAKLDKYANRFEDLGYKVMGEYGIQGRRFYLKGGNNRTHHIHAFEVGDTNIMRHLAFRDYLKVFDEVRMQYEALKLHLAKTCHNDINIYCDGKYAFIQEHEAKALIWKKEQNAN